MIGLGNILSRIFFQICSISADQFWIVVVVILTMY
jgi:hypothetical protein